MTNVMMKTCLNQKIIKISNLIQAVKNSVCPKAKVMRRPNFEVTLIHLTRATNFALDMRHRFNPRKSNDYQRYSIDVLYPRQFIFAPSCRRRPILQSTER